MAGDVPAKDSLRCFIGLPVDHLLGLELLSLRDELVAAIPGAQPRPVPAANFHMTLAFLGSIPAQQVDAVAALMEAVAANHAPFTQPLESVGLFPPGRGRCLAAQGQAVDDLRVLVRDLQQRLRVLGVPVEMRDFLPHITLARLGLTPVPAPQRAIRLPCHAQTLALFESVSRGGSVHYRRLRHAELSV